MHKKSRHIKTWRLLQGSFFSNQSLTVMTEVGVNLLAMHLCLQRLHLESSLEVVAYLLV